MSSCRMQLFAKLSFKKYGEYERITEEIGHKHSSKSYLHKL